MDDYKVNSSNGSNGLAIQGIKEGLNTKVVGNEILIFDTISSTMDIARKRMSERSSEGMAIFAEEQTKGKGRLGRVWTCPKGKGLLATIILKPKIQSDKICFLTGISSIAVVEAIQHASHITATVKWPNDIIIGNKKVAGILIEANGSMRQQLTFSVGIGINVNLTNDELPEQALIPATSLALEKGCYVDRIVLARTLLQSLDTWYYFLQEGEYEFIRERWKALCLAFDRGLVVREGDNEYIGRFMDITPGGDLVLEFGDHTRKIFRHEYIQILPHFILSEIRA